MKIIRMLFAITFLSFFIVSPSDSNAFTGKADLSWGYPSFTDGSPLNPATDLREYRVYCGSTAGVYAVTPAAVVSGGTTTNCSLNNLGIGTTYCVVTAVTTAVLGSKESAWSNEGSKTIAAPAPGGCTTFQMK